jgi:hemerythrin superfamily protein
MKLRLATALSANAIVRPLQPQNIRLLSASTARMSRISDAIKKDHRELEQYYNNIINAKDSDEATRWQNQFTWELARHSIGEELVVYPSFEKLLGQQGKQMADKDRTDHQAVRPHPISKISTLYC